MVRDSLDLFPVSQPVRMTLLPEVNHGPVISLKFMQGSDCITEKNHNK